MRLYLSSFRLGDSTDVLMDLIDRGRQGRRVAVIANSIDEGTPEQRASGVAGEIEGLSGLGLHPEEVDLRQFGTADVGRLERTLTSYSALWLRGGNVFALRHAMAASGADQLIPRLLADDAFVYSGYSAGPCVLAPTLRGLELCDDPEVVRRLYDESPIWGGLGVLDRPFVPHLDTPGHPESEVLGALAAQYRQDGVPFWALRDGQVLVVDGDLSTAIVR
jgi:dipeptidase E